MPRKKAEVVEVEKIWLSTKEAAKYLGVTVSYIGELRRKGILPHSRIGNVSFFKKSEIDWMLEQNKVY